MTTLTKDEVSKWPAMGPMNLDPARILALLDERDTLREQLAAANAELNDMRRAWTIIREPDDLRHAHTATEAAQQIATRHAAAIARAERAEAERDSFDADNKRLTERLHHAQAERDEARAAVQAACDAAVTAACSAVESERDAAYAQRNLANEQLLDAMDREQKARIEAGRLREACAAALTLEHISQPAYDEVHDRVAAALASSDAGEWLKAHDAAARSDERARVKAWFRAELQARGFGQLAEYLDGFEAAAPCIGCDEATCSLCVRRRALSALDALAASPKGRR